MSDFALNFIDPRIFFQSFLNVHGLCACSVIVFEYYKSQEIPSGYCKPVTLGWYIRDNFAYGKLYRFCLKTFRETYSEPCQTSKIERFAFSKMHHLRCLLGFWIRIFFHDDSTVKTIFWKGLTKRKKEEISTLSKKLHKI